MILEYARPLTEISIGKLLGGNGRPVRKADKLIATREPTV